VLANNGRIPLAVRKPFRHIERTLIFFIQLDGDRLQKSGALRTQIDDDI
jgi:hypothetical protein